jgi:hypothetical protein
MNATKSRLSGAAIAGIAIAALGGCGGSSQGSGNGSAATPPPPPATADDPTVIPASAGSSGKAMVSYVGSLPADEVAAEPNTFAAGFADPPEDGDEPVPAS